MVKPIDTGSYRSFWGVVKMDKREHILVPLDFSPATPDILKMAERLAEENGSQVVLLHVVELFDALKQRAPLIQEDVLQDYIRLFRRIPGHRVSSMAREGDPVEVIVDIAESYPCWAIVMGRGGNPERPGHVAAAVRKQFKGKTHWVPTAGKTAETAA